MRKKSHSPFAKYIRIAIRRRRNAVPQHRRKQQFECICECVHLTCSVVHSMQIICYLLFIHTHTYTSIKCSSISKFFLFCSILFKPANLCTTKKVRISTDFDDILHWWRARIVYFREREREWDSYKKYI